MKTKKASSLIKKNVKVVLKKCIKTKTRNNSNLLKKRIRGATLSMDGVVENVDFSLPFSSSIHRQ